MFTTNAANKILFNVRDSHHPPTATATTGLQSLEPTCQRPAALIIRVASHSGRLILRVSIVDA